MESARLAEPVDVSAIEAINTRQRDEVKDERGGSLFLRREAGPEPITERIEHGIERGVSGGVIVVVGCYDDVPFGYGYAAIEELLDGTRLARLTDFVVDADARKAGIGEAMMNLLIEHAKAADCIGIDSVALPGDRNTKNFFESFGLKARLLTVHRAFD